MTAEQVIEYFEAECRKLTDKSLSAHERKENGLAEYYRHTAIELTRIIKGGRTLLERSKDQEPANV